jgi:hypothetical protein
MRTIFPAAALCVVALALVPPAAQAQQLQPGQWNSSSKLIHIEGAGLPPAMAEAMTSEPPDTDTRCVDAKQAATGLQDMLKEKNQMCAMVTHSFAGGVLDATRSCKGNGGVSVIHLHGPVTQTGFTLDADGTGPHGVKMAMRFTAKRLGACK